MAYRDHPAAVPPALLRARAKTLRRHMLRMASRLGEGYIGQGLAIADVLAALYFSDCATTRATRRGPTGTASSSRPATTRSRSGRRWPRRA